MRHIAIVGKMHAGKTTLAGMLVERGYTKFGLADPVKACAATAINAFMMGMDLCGEPEPTPMLTVDDINRDKAVYRPFLQWLGTDLARKFLYDDEVWIRVFRRNIALITTPVVCDDVRFPNEAQALKPMGFHVIRLSRPEEERLESIKNSGTALAGLTHQSETEVDRIPVDDEWLCRNLADLEQLADILVGRHAWFSGAALAAGHA